MISFAILQGINPREGLPKLRTEWIKKRQERGDKVYTQMHYARKGVITEEMAFCAARERLEPEFIRSEVNMLLRGCGLSAIQTFASSNAVCDSKPCPDLTQKPRHTSYR